MAQAITIKRELPCAADFKTLRNIAGWGNISLETAQRALEKSLHGATAYDGTSAIGMARIVGDGLLNTYIQDVVIAPHYRGQGIGKAILNSLIEDMKKSIPEDCSIGLMAAKGQEGFYSSFSFITRPNTDYGAGMFAQLSDLVEEGTRL